MTKRIFTIIFIFLLFFSLMGCGTLATISSDEPKNKVFSGTRVDIDGWYHGLILDLLFSLILDTALLPYTIPKTIANSQKKNDDEKNMIDSPTQVP